MSFDEQLERMQADGRMSPGDADEVRHFAAFLQALADAGVPRAGARRTHEQRRAFRDVYHAYYPEEYARAYRERAEQEGDALERLRYGHPTTSDGSPAGPDDEGGPET